MVPSDILSILKKDIEKPTGNKEMNCPVDVLSTGRHGLIIHVTCYFNTCLSQAAAYLRVQVLGPHTGP